MDINNDINLNDLWQRRTVTTPDIQTVLSRVKRYTTVQRNRTWQANLTLIATSVFIALVWVYFDPQYLSTKIGTTLVILAILSFVFVNTKAYLSFSKNSRVDSVQQQLRAILDWKARQKFIRTTALNTYFLALTVGLGLYMYEYTSKMELIWGLVTYGITLIWILFNWFYIRPKQQKKQQREIDEILENLESINRQFDE